MIILDTNVVSEPLRPDPSPYVSDWLDRQAAETLYLTAVSLAELMAGIALLPDGRRKQGLTSGLDRVLTRLFGPRILPFDRHAAIAYAPMRQRARDTGQPTSFADAQIAAIALHQGFAVATRDTRPFRSVGITVIDPFQAIAAPEK